MAFGPRAGRLIDELDSWSLLSVGDVDCVAVFGLGVVPFDGDCQQGVEFVDYCWYYFCFL